MVDVYINKCENEFELVITEDKKVVEYYTLNEEHNNSIEGNIYIGKVRNIIQGMQSFFIDIGQSKNGFLFFNDIYEKFDGVYEKTSIDSDKISKLLKNGQNVLVQIKKEPIDKKGAKLTTDISLIGRYFILTPKSHFIAVSKKISQEDKDKCIDIVRKYLPEEYGGIIRTNIFEATTEEIETEILELVSKWNVIKKFDDNIAKYEKPMLVYTAEDIFTRTILDVLNKALGAIYTNDISVNNRVKEIVNGVDIKYVDKIINVEVEDLLKEYYLRKEIKRDLQEKVWLKCGGYLIINKTEALTAIDVNTGKYIGKNDLETTVFEVNKEAVKEIARQLRLRNMGGIIIVDFIDMHKEEHKQEILELLKSETKKDRSKIDVKGYTKLNLMEITRKRKKT